MADTAFHLSGLRVLECAADGPALRDDRDATRLISMALEHDAELVALPAARLAADFFDLANGVAGAFIQKFVNYRLRLAFVGDLSVALTGSRALEAYVRESNRGVDVWFVADLLELERRLSGPAH